MRDVSIEVAARRIAKRLKKLPVSVEELCALFDIRLYFTDLKHFDAYYMTLHGRRLIAVNDKLIKTRQRFSIAHEFAHAYLNHGPIAFSSSASRPTWQEREANHFAAELLMPKPLLVQHGYLTPEDIAELCNVSRHAARIRAEELGWRQRELGFTSADHKMETE